MTASPPRDHEQDVALQWQTLAAPNGRTLLLLTLGAVAVLGHWHAGGGFTAWCALPPPGSPLWHRPGDGTPPPLSGTLLLLSLGGAPTLGAWRSDAGFVGWCRLPAHQPCT